MQRKHLSERYLAAGMVGSMFLWGLSWPSGKILTRYCTAANFTTYRYLFVVASMLLLLPAMRVSFRISRRGLPAVLASGVLLAIYGYFFFMGLKTGSPGAGGVLVTTLNPLIAYTINIVLRRKFPTGNEALGLLLGATAGCVLLKIWDTSVSLLDGGNIYFLLAALTWSIMSKFTAQGAKHGASMSFSLWQYLVTLLCVLPFCDYHELYNALHVTDPLFWLNLFFGSAIVTAIATTVYFYTTTRLGAERASSFIFLVPFAAAISSWLFLGEHIKLHTAIGGLLGIAAVYTINRKGKKTDHFPQAMEAMAD